MLGAVHPGNANPNHVYVWTYQDDVATVWNLFKSEFATSFNIDLDVYSNNGLVQTHICPAMITARVMGPQGFYCQVSVVFQ